MKYIGSYYNRKTFYLKWDNMETVKFPNKNWVCFAISNEKPDNSELDSFVRKSIQNDLYEFKGQGDYGEYLHDFFDETMVEMEVIENHPEIEIMTTGDNKTDLANGLWECYGATCLPERADFDDISIICLSFDKLDYSEKLEKLLSKFNRNWLPDDKENRLILKDEKMKLKLTKSESLVLYDFLSRLNNNPNQEIFEDSAEEKILWDLECMFERELKSPFKRDYKERVKLARDKVREDVK